MLKSGLNSIHDRLSKLEEEQTPKPMPRNLLNKLQQKVNEKKTFELDKMQIMFEENISNEISNLSDCNLVEIIVFSIQFINENSENICKLLGHRKTHELESHLICSLCETVLNVSHEIISVSVETLRKMLGDKQIKEDICVNQPISTALVKRSSSRMFKFKK